MACPSLKTSSSSLATQVGDVLIVPLHEGKAKLPPQLAALDQALGGALSAARRHGDFDAGEGAIVRLYRAAGVKAPRVVFYGLGAAKKGDAEALRRAGTKLAAAVSADGCVRPVVAVAGLAAAAGFDAAEAAAHLAEGFGLQNYRSPDYKREKDADAPPLARSLTLVLATAREATRTRKLLERTRVLVDSVHDCRDMGNTPANHMTPSHLARYARKVARETGAKVQVLGVPEMKKLGMGALLGVAQGSAEPPRLIVLDYHPRGAKKTLAFVGKGVTFDSGGISLKPWKPMWDMKYDMCGAAAVLAGFRALARLKGPHRVVALVGATENLPDGKAYKPGDVVVSASGKSIEIHSTDAEGRVVLADVLHHARKFQPDLVVDFATLTGAVITALGHHCSAVMGNDDALARKLVAAGERSGDRVWQLPLWEEYGESLKSVVADVCNTGDGTGGSIQGGWFLQQFVDYPWCHVDIAGTAWLGAEQGTFPKGGTGFGVRLIVAFAEEA